MFIIQDTFNYVIFVTLHAVSLFQTWNEDTIVKMFFFQFHTFTRDQIWQLASIPTFDLRKIYQSLLDRGENIVKFCLFLRM